MKSQSKFKTKLTVEQSAKLIELGVDASLASKCRVQHEADFEVEYRIVPHDEFCYEMASLNPQPIFDLSDILSILPKEIKFGITTYHLNIDYPPINQVAARYIDEDDEDNDLKGFMCGELIDSLYLLLIWVIEIGFVKLNTEKK